MSIKRYNSEKDNTISTAFRENLSTRSTKANMGASDILELFSIYGQASSSSVEKTRILIQFPVSEIATDRSLDIVPLSGSSTFRLRVHNARHGQTTPENYQVSVHPLVRAWNEGGGLDMESYLDLESSNWISASSGVAWHTTGSDFINSDYVTASVIPLEYNQFLKEGTEDLNIDITGLVEEWIKYNNNLAIRATASINLVSNLNADDVIKIRSHEGEEVTYKFVAGAGYSVGQSVFLQLSGSKEGTISALKDSISTDFSGSITTTLEGAYLSLTQSVAGLHGNTVITTTAPTARITYNSFDGGIGMPNYGVLLKLDHTYEDGSRARSYYTKKFYSRSSHEFFLKPKIEAQWDNSIRDDRGYILKSSSLAPAADNLNSIYFYNRIRGQLADIPTGSNTAIVASLYHKDELGSTFLRAESLSPDAGGVSSAPLQFITASRESKGVYKAQFAYAGTASYLYDVWSSSTDHLDSTLATGSGFTVYTDSPDNHYEMPNYKVSITNLKDTYLQSEKATIRVYTRNKNWQPNVYTKARSTAPVNTIRDLFYKITKVSDNFDVISYSTGSVPSYSSLSYDISGSHFDLDMSIFEPNNAYEISFVSKDGSNYVEQQEKFRFRVDP